MANRVVKPGSPEREAGLESDRSVFALEDSVDEVWGQTHRVIQAMGALPDLRTHRLDVRLGKKRLALFPQKHHVPLPDGSVAEVKWDEKMECWRLFEMKKAWGNEKFTVRIGSDESFLIMIEPIADDQFWLGNIIWRFQRGLASLDEKFSPVGKPMDPQQLGGVFVMSLDNKNLEFGAVYAGDEMGDPFHYQLVLDRSDPACQHLCEPMIRLLAQVFGRSSVGWVDGVILER